MDRILWCRFPNLLARRFLNLRGVGIAERPRVGKPAIQQTSKSALQQLPPSASTRVNVRVKNRRRKVAACMEAWRNAEGMVSDSRGITNH